MISDEEFLKNYLSHAYDPVKAREYYLRTRKLKGKKAGAPVDPQSKVAYNGSPVVIKPGKRMEEDEVPNKSPSGAKIVDYDGTGLGKVTYADGSSFTTSGWNTPAAKAGPAAKASPVAKAATSAARKRRIGAAEQKLIRAKTLANKVKDPSTKRKLLQQLSATEKKLKAVKATAAPPVSNSPKPKMTKRASTKPVLRRTEPTR